MSAWASWWGDLHRVMPSPWVETVLVLAAAVAGGLVGWERELKAKAAGLRTVILIALGAAIYTMMSVALARGFDPARVAAQIVPGIGFIGAGVILQARGQIVGLTTAATIWATAAIGMTIGAGYALAGLALSAVAVLILVGVQRLENALLGPCRIVRFQVVYDPAGGKTFQRLQGILDEFRVMEADPAPRPHADGEAIEIAGCGNHLQHRAYLAPIAEVPAVRAITRL